MTYSNLKQKRIFFWKDANCTRLFVVIQGTIGGLAGMAHGIFEVLLGNRPTKGLVFDQATGAFTILPTYLMTGIAAICVGLALILWTIGFIHRKNGPPIFLFICALLFLVGGGIAQVGFFLIAWAVSIRINQPINWWKRDLFGKKRRRLARLWPSFFTAGYLFLFVGIAIWLIFTPPGASFSEHVSAFLFCWISLLISLVFQFLTIISGFARDVEKQ